MYDIEASPDFEKDRLSKLYSAAEQQQYTDVKFTVNNRSIFAHMVVLATCSEIFVNESVDNLNVIFSHFNNDIVDALFKYCYTGIIHIDDDLYDQFKDLATQLQITNLYYKNIDVKNSLEALTLSNDVSTIETAMDVTLENFENLYKTPDFLRLPVSILIEIIKSDYLNVSSEMFVLESVKLWVEDDDKKRRPKLKHLLSFVKLPALIMELNHTNLLTDYYLSSEYIQIVNDVIESIMKNHRNTNERRRREKIVLVGSHFHSYNKHDYDIFNSKENKWVLSKDYMLDRTDYISVLVDNWIMIIGGLHSGKGLLGSVDYIDLKDGQIHSLKPLNQIRGNLSAVVIHDNTSFDVYVIGGQHYQKMLSSVERWNSKTKNWEFVARLKRRLYNHSASVIDDRIYVTGGIIKEDGEEITTNKVQMYSSRTNEWSYCARMIHKRSDHTSVTIKGKLYVGGGNNKTSISDIESYDPIVNLWTPFCQLPSPREFIIFCNFRNKLLCIGGVNKKSRDILDDVLEYDDTNKNWKTLKSLSFPKMGNFTAHVVPYLSVI